MAGKKGSEQSMKDDIWSLDRIIPFPGNVRVHPPKQIALLASILKRRGPDQRIVVDDKGVILKGHGRRLAAIDAGLSEFPVTQRFGLSETEKREIRLEDNKISELSSWDPSLADELAVLSAGGTDLITLGFNPQLEAEQPEATKKASDKKTIFVTVPQKAHRKARAAIVKALDAAGIEHNL